MCKKEGYPDHSYIYHSSEQCRGFDEVSYVKKNIIRSLGKNYATTKKLQNSENNINKDLKALNK